MTDYIAAINFPERSKTYEAFSKIKADSERLGVVSAALVEIDENGRVTVQNRGHSPHHHLTPPIQPAHHHPARPAIAPGGLSVRAPLTPSFAILQL